MKINTGTKPIGSGTHDIDKDIKKFKGCDECSKCIYCVIEIGKFPCTAPAPKEYRYYRYSIAHGVDCKVFKPK
jgi:hypothetical protein